MNRPILEPTKVIIYVAGPYRAKTRDLLTFNIKEAELASIRLLAKGYIPFTPHKNFAFYDDYNGVLGMEPKDWIRIVSTFLERCDGIYFLSGWQESEGSLVEEKMARDLELPIVPILIPPVEDFLATLEDKYLVHKRPSPIDR